MPKITITAGDVTMQASLNNGSTAQAIADVLPIEGNANIWGDEIYFSIPIEVDEEPDAQADVAVGTLAYWPPGNAFCIFYGPTPASTNDQPRAASPVNVIGQIDGDASEFRAVLNGTPVKIKLA